MLSGIAQAINALIKSGNEEGNPLTLPGFKTVDIYQTFEHLFTKKAKASMEKHSESLIYQYNEVDYNSKVCFVLAKLGLRSCSKYGDINPVNAYIRKCDVVHFAACRATKNNLHKAVERVVAAVNHVTAKDFTKASLVKLSTVELMPVNASEPEYAVISYITLTQKGSEYVKNNLSDIFIPEGGIPMKVE